MKSNSKNPRPLVVSLHTWSGDFNQNDTLVWQCVDRDYNYIHPNFRGPNRTVEACGSPLVISDIDDAIDYAIAHGNVDINEIHVIGSSGGGYATLLCYMQSRHHIKSFASWVPISNLIDWYNEVRIREPEHALDIAKATTGKNFDTNWHYIDEEEAKKRSPIYMQTATLDRSKSKLSIYAGVHDGFTGAVPITHSINMYNKLVMDNDRERIHCQVSKDETISLLTSRGAGRKGMHHTLADRPIHLQRAYKDMISSPSLKVRMSV
ncbi:MAG: prolyl oligopeptidase family serine peptidase [Cyclobacteriaceae bacterium]|nr:prolyl oligopeptidase family serine peptidase [Cyclobacteriaceae bacterium]